MNGKKEALASAREAFNRWEVLVGGLSDAQLTTPQAPSILSIKDTLAHLRAWQQRSIARLEAGLRGGEPDYPRWPSAADPDSYDPPDELNAWIFETHRHQPWPRVHEDWRAGFLRFLELGEAVPEADLLAAGRYPWLDGHPLVVVLTSSQEHHEEHLEQVLFWLRMQRT